MELNRNHVKKEVAKKTTEENDANCSIRMDGVTFLVGTMQIARVCAKKNGQAMINCMRAMHNHQLPAVVAARKPVHERDSVWTQWLGMQPLAMLRAVDR
jgi:hypothetical protein